MSKLSVNSWPSARQFAEAVQCPAVCFAEPALKGMLPAVDRLGMPLVTSGQFAYVFKLNAPRGGDALAVRCFRGFLGDREARYRALDAHLGAHRLAALPRFRYLPEGILVAGRKYPALAMEWIAGPTLDVYLDEVVGRREVLSHLADEWLRLMHDLRASGAAHGDLQHGNVIVERGRLRLVDLDGMFVPALAGMQSSEVGHQHYQHPARAADFFSLAVDNFSALVVYLSLVALAERPQLWAEHHDENLIFRRSDFADPDASALFRQVRETGEEQARLADVLADAAKSDPAETPWLLDLLQARPKLPLWMSAPDALEVGARTREVARAEPPPTVMPYEWTHGERDKRMPARLSSDTVQTIFGAQQVAPSGPPRDPADIAGNAFHNTLQMIGQTGGYVWWLPLHTLFFEEFWSAAFGAGDSAGMLFTILLFFAVYWLCGLGRALYNYSEHALSAPPDPQGFGLAPADAAHAALPAPAPADARADAFAMLFGVGQMPPPTKTTTAAQPSPVSQSRAATQPLSAAGSQPSSTVVGNRSLNIYHLPACVWVDRIAARSRVEFDSPAPALQAGFRPCRVCLP